MPFDADLRTLGRLSGRGNISDDTVIRVQYEVPGAIEVGHPVWISNNTMGGAAMIQKETCLLPG